jgi:glycolate oxidase
MSLSSLLDAIDESWHGDRVFSDRTHLRAYAADAYAFDSAAPQVVFLPRTVEEVQQAVRWCVEHGVALTPRGAGTGLSGGCVSHRGGAQIVCTRLRRILEIDPVDRVAVVEAGVVNSELSEKAAPFGLCFAPDPSSQIASTIGGNFAENAGGPHTLKYGVTRGHVLGVEMVDGRGEWVRLGGRSAVAPGGDLLGVHCGAEGTLGIVTRLTVHLTPLPPAVRTSLAIFPSPDAAADAVAAIIAAGVVPAAMELIDRVVLRAVEAAYSMGFPLDAGAVLLLEMQGSEAAVDEERSVALRLCAEHGAWEVRDAATEAERQDLWRARKHAFGAMGRLSPRYATQDGVVPRAAVPAVVRHIGEVARRHELEIGVVLHAGDGNIHPAILYDDRDPRSVEASLRASEEILRFCIDVGGSPTGEHGVGLEKRSFLSRTWSPAELDAMHRLREAIDPDGWCNPEKILPASAGCGEARVAQQAART